MNKLYAVLAGLLLSFSAAAQDTAFDLSGAWFDAENPGWGLLVDDGAEGTFAALFTYNFSTDSAGQAWYVGYTPRADDFDASVTLETSFELNRPTGEFPAWDWQEAPATLQLDITEIDATSILAVWGFHNAYPCVRPVVSPRAPWCEGEVVFTRLLSPKDDGLADESDE